MFRLPFVRAITAVVVVVIQLLAIAVMPQGRVALAQNEPVAAQAVPGRFIVTLKQSTGISAASAASTYNRKAGVDVDQVYTSVIDGFAGEFNATALKQLQSDPNVASITPDYVVRASAQELPAGINRIDADLNPTKAGNNSGSVSVDVAVLDTGVYQHADLNVVGGKDCTVLSGGNPYSDYVGHGTHVAGTIGAKDDGVGVVGVAPGARLWAVRVFRADGSSLLSWIICGIDWVTGQKDPNDPSKPRLEAANMSLRDAGSDDGNCGYTNGDSEHQAICASVAAGVAYAVAAGNDSTSASKWIPAAYDEVITVSALADFNGTGGGGAASTCSSFRSADSDDTFADFSNYGPDIDLIAPGKCIYSTYPTTKSTGTGYAVLSGTSMASPHVAGAIALYRAEHPLATPADVKAALQGAATLDWFTNTDPDATHERLLNVSSFGGTPGFSLTASPASVTLNRNGGTATYTVDVIRGNGYSSDVSLFVSGLPSGATASFSPAVLVGLGGLSSALKVSVPRTTPAGTYGLTITGTTADGASRTATVTLVKR